MEEPQLKVAASSVESEHEVQGGSKNKESNESDSSANESASNLVSVDNSNQISKDVQTTIGAVPKKRGRPPKAKNGDDLSNIIIEEDTAEPVAKRKRGRPKKSAVEIKLESQVNYSPKTKYIPKLKSRKPLLARSKERKKSRGRGRPPKITKYTESEEEEDEEFAEVLPKKKRGRPPIDKMKSGRPAVAEKKRGRGRPAKIYEVEAITDSRKKLNCKNKLEYLVKWVGWDDENDLTWESEESLAEGSLQLLQEFKAKLEKSKRSESESSHNSDSSSITSTDEQRKYRPGPKSMRKALKNRREHLSESPKPEVEVDEEKEAEDVREPLKKRGRPPKKSPSERAESNQSKKRGRPKISDAKQSTTTKDNYLSETEDKTTGNTVSKKGRGRPPKKSSTNHPTATATLIDDDDGNSVGKNEEGTSKRGRRRPPKKRYQEHH